MAGTGNRGEAGVLSIARCGRRRHRTAGRQPLLLLTLLAYMLAGAVVPPGHMAAPVSDGAPFHLCPGDARSALIIDALGASTPGHQHHHHQHAGADAGNGVAETSADPGCTFAGFGASLAQNADLPDAPAALALASGIPRSARHATAGWLRPPARSPPA